MSKILDLFETHFGRKADWHVRAPGRVNLLGEHVDYNDGPAIPVAINLEVELAVAQNPDGIFRIKALDLDEQTDFSLETIKDKEDIHHQPLNRWATYPAGVAFILQQYEYPMGGIDAVFHSNIPIGAGLSSSAALEVAFAALWQAINGWNISRLELAQLCQKAENDYVGVSCGLMDQFTSACGVKDHALYFDTRTLEWQAIALPDNITIVILDSGIRRSLVDSAYNERRASCENAVELLRVYKPDIASLRDISSVEFAAYAHELPVMERNRAEHVIKEIGRVQSAVNALSRCDLQALGALMYAAHVSLRDLYKVSHPMLDLLVELAKVEKGIIGARLTGAGFGGCTINLVESEYANTFARNVCRKYQQQTRISPQSYICSAVDGVTVQSLAPG
jgi:galactokinase